MKKIIVTICAFMLISLSAFSAIGSNFKNSLLSVDVKKTGESSYNIILNTQSPYAEPIKVIQKSDYDYYILLPETYSLIPESSSNSDIKNFSVKLYPYAGQSSENGYTKITILTVRPLSFSTSIKSLDNNMPTVSDLDRIAKLNSLDNDTINQIKEAQPKTVSPKETAPQKQTVKEPVKVQTPQKQQTPVKVQTTPQKQVAQTPIKPVQVQTAQKPVQTQVQTPQKQSQEKTSQPQKIAQNTPSTNKVSNPINVSRARKDYIADFTPKASEVKAPEKTVSETISQDSKKAEVKNTSQTKQQTTTASVNKEKLSKVSATKQASKKYTKPAKPAASESAVKQKSTQEVKKAEPVKVAQKEAKPSVQPVKQQEEVKPSPEVEVQKPVVSDKEQNPEKQNGEAPALQENKQDSDTGVENLEEINLNEDENTGDEDILSGGSKFDEIKDKIKSVIPKEIGSIPLTRSNIIIGLLSFIIFFMFFAMLFGRRKRPKYETVPQNAHIVEEPKVVEVHEEVAPNTYIEEPETVEVQNEAPINDERPVIEPNIVEQYIEEPELIQNTEPEVSQNEVLAEPSEANIEILPNDVDEEVPLDDLDESYLNEVEDMEAFEEKMDQKEFEDDEEIEIEETEQAVYEESGELSAAKEETEEAIEETPAADYEIDAPVIEEESHTTNRVGVQNPIKEEPKVQQQSYVDTESTEDRGADVLSSVQIDSNKGFCVTYYNNQLILIGYVGENIFLIHKFKRGEITNAQIKFRLSDSNLDEDFYMVKVDNSKFLVKVTPNNMALELLV